MFLIFQMWKLKNKQTDCVHIVSEWQSLDLISGSSALEPLLLITTSQNCIKPAGGTIVHESKGRDIKERDN